MEPVQVVRAFFVLGTSTFLLGYSIPPIRDTLLGYGSRNIPPVPEKLGAAEDDSKVSKAAKDTLAQPPRATANNGVLAYLGSFQVPHAWFWHFYLVSVLSSIFWATNILLQTRIWLFVLKWQQDASMTKFEGSSKAGMTFDQVVLTWALMAVQGSRRLYESITLARPSQSRMPISHWVLGVLFYVGTGMAVWVEGISVLRKSKPTVYDLSLAGPSVRTFIGVSLFLVASGVQHDCHKYLASLKKYTLPQLPIFRALICPHFSAECVIYLALSIVAAPEGNLVNTTFLTILIFTAINLGITADFNREWYAKKFGEKSIEGRWRMVPYFY